MIPLDKLTPDERRVLAEAAKRITNEDAFIRATETVRAAALEKLVKADPADLKTITHLQAQVLAIDNIRQELVNFTAAAPRQTQNIR